MADVLSLMKVLHRLVEEGNTVVTIEHNFDVIAEADWVIDLGPEGGDNGGKIIAQAPCQIVRTKKPHILRHISAVSLQSAEKRKSSNPLPRPHTKNTDVLSSGTNTAHCESGPVSTDDRQQGRQGVSV
jgi:energy-coupling factor transporter ATP-binding protein EcfA2